MKKMNQANTTAARQIPPGETKTQPIPSSSLPPHSTIRKVQTPSLGPEFSRLYLASLIGRQRS